MNWFKINKLKIDGNGNISIQDISNSTIAINTTIPESLQSLLEDLINWQTPNNTLNIIVVATTQEHFETISEVEFKSFIPLQNYAKEPKEWKPYNNENSISELIKEFHEKSGFKIDAIFIDNLKIDDEIFLSELKDDISPNTILIIDGLSLYFTENREFAKIFDKSDIGGCVIPICEKHIPEIKSFIFKNQKQVFRHLNTCYFKRFHQQYMFVELDVPTKEISFRKLTNIAIKHLDLKPQPKINWNERIMQRKENESLANLKSTIQSNTTTPNKRK